MSPSSSIRGAFCVNFTVSLKWNAIRSRLTVYGRLHATWRSPGNSRCPFQTIFRRSRTSYEGYASPPADTLARVDEFLTCSDWSRGVARVKCTACDYSYFRPFSCKSFHLSPGTPLRGLPAATRSAQSFTRSIWPRNCFWNFPIASSSSRYPATSLRSFRPENPYGILHSLVSRRGLQADF